MLGSSDSHGSAPTGPVEHGRSDLPSQGQIRGRIDLSHRDGPTQLKELLKECAQAVLSNDWEIAHDRIQCLLGNQLSAQGDSFERVASYFTAALATHISKATGTQISLPLALVQPPGSDELLTAYLALNQVTPFVRFAHLTANQALLEALDGEWYLHIVDLDIVHGLQWPPFMQALVDVRADQGAGLPQLCITGIGKDRQVLEMTGRRLVSFAQSIGLPFEFIPLIHQNLDSLRPTMLRLRSGEALAVNCMLQLHTLLDEEGTGALEFFLGMLHSLNPRVVTLAEREANTNPFADALEHYKFLFESLEATLPRTSLERTQVEQLWFWKEISNIVAATREGQESSSSLDSRVVRYQKFDQWRIFMETAGFQLLPTSKFALDQARLLLRLHYPSEGYRLVEDDAGCLLLGWKNDPLFAVSSWNAV
ncbi:unnamed protein product [Sphagnum jensenii]|jgi:hypothetical protein|uniref:Uncharacterized protein n=1 Tax=Sphagnum jensenii TaxID=128206 RepID=A0ABP0WFG0_9BRYO